MEMKESVITLPTYHQTKLNESAVEHIGRALGLLSSAITELKLAGMMKQAKMLSAHTERIRAIFLVLFSKVE